MSMMLFFLTLKESDLKGADVLQVTRDRGQEAQVLARVERCVWGMWVVEVVGGSMKTIPDNLQIEYV